jgi:hypothetical protein
MAPELVEEFLKELIKKALHRKATFIRSSFFILYLYRAEESISSLCLVLHL